MSPLKAHGRVGCCCVIFFKGSNVSLKYLNFLNLLFPPTEVIYAPTSSPPQVNIVFIKWRGYLSLSFEPYIRNSYEC